MLSFVIGDKPVTGRKYNIGIASIQKLGVGAGLAPAQQGNRKSLRLRHPEKFILELEEITRDKLAADRS